jgi:hypothetical protein
MIIYEDTFTTRLGTDFKFAFDFNDGCFEIHILEQPSYGGRDDNNHLTHRITTDSGFKICWTGELRNLAEAKAVAAKWACLTEAYILKGEQFPS